MSDNRLDPDLRRANLRLAIVLGLVALGFFAAFIYVTGSGR